MLESILVIPVVFAMILGILQAGLWWYARQVALTTAQQAARSARDYNATSADGTASATSYLHQVNGSGGGILLNPTVTVDRGPATVTVTVHGHVPAILPFLPSDVSATASGPVEQYEPPS